MSGGIGNIFSSFKGLMQTSNPVSPASHVDHPPAQPSPIPSKTNPITSAQPLVPPKRQNSHAGGSDPKIEQHGRTRRVSEMGPVRNPTKSSGRSEGGWNDRAEAQPVGQERNQEERSVESRRKIEKLRGDVRALKDEREALKQKVAAMQAQVREEDTKYDSLLKQFKILQDENNRLLSQINFTKSDAVSKERLAGQRIAEVESRNQRQEEEIRTLRQHILQSNEKHANTDRLLQVRTADLKGVETFLTTADEYSGAEIMKMVESLNGEIFQVSAFMAEALERESLLAAPEEKNKNITHYREVLGYAQGHIGDRLLSHLRDKPLEVQADALPVQLGLQALLTTWCTFMVRCFTTRAFDNDLHRLYGEIRKSEAQSIAGRWRAITSTQMRVLNVEVETQRTFMIDLVLSLMCLCGWSIGNQESLKIILSFQQMVERIEKMWSQLKKAAKEGITNTDMEVFIIPPGSNFEFENMEDMYDDVLGNTKSGNLEKRRREKILCSVGIGLRKSLVKREDGKAPHVQQDILIKPKVALASVLLGATEGGMIGESRPRSQYFGK